MDNYFFFVILRTYYRYYLPNVNNYVLQWLWRFKRRYAVEAGKSDDGTIHVHTEDAALEQKHDLGSFPQVV